MSICTSVWLAFSLSTTRLIRITVILTVLRQVLLGLGNDVASRDSLFNSIADTFQEFVVEYAELMTEDDERLGDLKKILRFALRENDVFGPWICTGSFDQMILIKEYGKYFVNIIILMFNYI